MPANPEILKRIKQQTKPYKVDMTGVGGKPIDQLHKSLEAMGTGPVQRLNKDTLKFDGHTWRNDGNGSVEFVDGSAAFRVSKGSRQKFEEGWDKINWKKKNGKT